MFRSHRFEVTGRLHAQNRVDIVFRSLDAALAGRRPRPRWKTALVSNQDLRWFRTSLLGRATAWMPALPAIGPWRDVVLTRSAALSVSALRLRGSAPQGRAQLHLHARLHPGPGQRLEGATVVVAGCSLAVDIHEDEAGDFILSLDAPLPGAALWWPLGQGAQALHPCRLELVCTAGLRVVDCGMLGFRSLVLDRSGGQVQLRVNGRAVFCRGACWTAEDPASLDGRPEDLQRTLDLAASAGLNMIRIGGTMTWASDALLAACDARGILVWQDLPFANLDLPVGDADFVAEVQAELRQQTARLAAHPCVALLCGGSEIAQQAAMLGLPREAWAGPFFEEQLPAWVAESLPDLPWFPSTPWEGDLPFHTGSGLCHYYGVGAYRRPLADVRRAGVRFSPECLGFSNIPDAETVRATGGGSRPAPHSPEWKRGVPRDPSAGWDFEDVRDHYLREHFGADPVALRSVDPERYLALSRVLTGELMLRVFAEWRRAGSGCGGALVWFLKDLRPGAGWGLIDSFGRPKAALWALRRAWAPQAALLTDEGLDGVAIHLHNEAPAPLSAWLELELLSKARHKVGQHSGPVSVPAWGSARLTVEGLLGHFCDPAYAYRFGPPRQDVVLVRLRASPEGPVLHQDALFPAGFSLSQHSDAGLRGEVASLDEDTVEVCLSADAFLQWLSIDAPGWTPDDDFFHLSPACPRSLRLRRKAGWTRPFKAVLQAINLDGSLTLRSRG